MIQGGRYERQAGQHFNPYTYDDIKTIADHRHYLGANPHGGNGRSDSAGGGHAHSGAMIYLGGSWPAEYQGSLFMNNIHGARINRDILKPSGSGFVGSHAPDFLLANDLWSQIISLKYGPDGSVFMIDWYDKNQCHHNDVNGHDRTNGRIFKVSFGETKAVQQDLQKLSSHALVQMQTFPNEWHARHARRILQERGASAEVNAHAPGARCVDRGPAGDPASHPPGPVGRRRSERSQPRSTRRLADTEAVIRAWTIQLATEQGPPAAPILARFAEMARTDPSPVVRLYLAAALQRLPLGERWDIVEGLVGHAGDAADHNLPLMYWYAAEPLAGLDASRAARLASGSKIPLDPGIHGAADRGDRDAASRWRFWSTSWAERLGPPSVRRS